MLQGTLCTELIRRLLHYAPQLHVASAVVAELDCLMAFAACARNQQYCRPALVADDVLVIEQGRHPLAELVVDVFIPNDTNMTGSQGRVQVITGAAGGRCPIRPTLALLGDVCNDGPTLCCRCCAGLGSALVPFGLGPICPNNVCDGVPALRCWCCAGPNASGKSCYIKQVATIAYMAHLGCFVPAKRAVVGIVDRIFTRLVSQESSKMQHSTFMIDLSQVSQTTG